MLRSDLARDPTFLSRFRREAQSAASLNHPKIVAVYDTGEDNGVTPPLPYIVMEYIDGKTLRDVLQNEAGPPRSGRSRSSPTSARRSSTATGPGSSTATSSPGNVMLTRTGAVKVMDFGIARAVAATPPR